jgi:hypothetical protein
MTGSGLFSFYRRFHIEMFKKACIRGKEHFNLLILGSLPTGGFFVTRRPPAGLPTQTKKRPGFSKNSWTLRKIWQPWFPARSADFLRTLQQFGVQNASKEWESADFLRNL